MDIVQDLKNLAITALLMIGFLGCGLVLAAWIASYQ